MPTPITRPPTFIEVLQAAVDAAGPDARGRSLVVQRVLQQLGTVIHPDVTRSKEGLLYTWKAVPLLGDLVLGADGKLSVPAIKAKEEPVVVANPAETIDKPRQPLMWAMSFKGLYERSPDPQRLAGVLAASSRVLLAGRP